MSHQEHMTRAAACAIGRDVGKMTWREQESGLVYGPFSINLWPDDLSADVFAPLVRAADAFQIESDLNLDIAYKANGKQVMIVVSLGEITYMVGYPVAGGREAALKARMLAVTQFAAMHASVEYANACR